MNAQQVSDILSVLAARFGTTVAHLWAVLVRQVYVEAVFNVVLGAIFTVAAIVAGRTVYRLWTVIVQPVDGYNRAKTFADGNEGLAIFATIAVALLVGGAVTFDIMAIGSLAQLANPEYGALKMLGAAINPSK